MIDTSDINASVAHTSVRKDTELRLITSDYGEMSDRGLRRMEFTEKGREIAKLFNEVNDILSK